MDSPRTPRAGLLALALVAALLGPAACGSDEPGEAERLRIEQSPVPPPAGELIVYVEPGANTPERAGGRSYVTLRCLDSSGSVVFGARHAWPFRDTDRGTLDPHIHQQLQIAGSRPIERCRLAGTEGPLEGRVRAEGLG